jgi:hypothetical protein
MGVLLFKGGVGVGMLKMADFRFPLQAGGTEPTRPTRFPSRSGGNLKEGGNCKLCPCDWLISPPAAQLRPSPRPR